MNLELPEALNPEPHKPMIYGARGFGIPPSECMVLLRVTVAIETATTVEGLGPFG